MTDARPATSYEDRYLHTSIDAVTVVVERFLLAWPARIDGPLQGFSPTTAVHRAVLVDDERDTLCATYVVRPSQHSWTDVADTAAYVMTEDGEQQRRVWPEFVDTNLLPFTIVQKEGWLVLDVPEGPLVGKYKSAGAMPAGVVAYIFRQLALELRARAHRKVAQHHELPELSAWSVSLSFNGDVVLTAGRSLYKASANGSELKELCREVVSPSITRLLDAPTLNTDTLALEAEDAWKHHGAMSKMEVARYARSLFADEYARVLERRERLAIWGDAMSDQLHTRRQNPPQG